MKEIVRIINEINDNMYDSNPKFFNEYNCYCEVSSNGLQTIVKFLDICIWDEDNDDRKFNEDANEYESLESYLREKITKIIKELNKIEVV
jgi:hypothetical protein